MRVAVQGGELHAVDLGPRAGLPVVFVHAFPLTHAMWEPQVEALSVDFRAIAYDVRGFGDSEVGDGQYTMELFVDDLVAVLDTLEVDRAVVCGLSMGGYIALRAVQRESGRVRALVLADTRSEADDDAGRLRRAQSIGGIKRDGLEPFAEAFLPLLFAPGNLDRVPAVVAKVRGLILAASPVGVSGAQLAMAARTDTTDALSDVSVPALVMVGQEDGLTPPARSEAMHRRLPDSELVLLPGAGHLSNLEDPDAFNQALRSFLQRLAS